MKRSPKGKLELLYLDEELRITRGEKGTVLVCERQN
ncbi:MAG: PAP/fibrillin family protein [Coleofasciculus sp. C2-GNP5-27]